MDILYRLVTPDEFAAFQNATSRAFGEYARPDLMENDQKIFQFDRSMAAFDGERIVGTGVLFPFRLTVPGNLEIAAGGVSWITVQPDYRRRGILTEIMRRQFHDALDYGEALAILYASESVIYGRFGFGMASMAAQFSIETGYRRFGRHVSGDGRVRLIDRDEAKNILPDVYDRVCRIQPGSIGMLPGWWEHHFTDPEPWWDGASPQFYAVYEDSNGRAQGFVEYRIESTWKEGFPAGTLRLVRMQSVSAEVRIALWEYLLSIDLIRTIETGDLPIDEPLRLALADPRRLRTTRYTDSIWTRVLDVPAALMGRRYRVDGEIVLDLTDPFLPENSGRYLLTGGPDGADCRRIDGDADLALEIGDVSAAYLGGTRLSALAEAGRVHELTPGALNRADLMFSGERTPFTDQMF